MNTENMETVRNTKAVQNRKKAKRKIRPIYTILLTGMVGLGTGFGGGYLAVKNFSPAPEVSVQSSSVTVPEQNARVVQTIAGINEGTLQDVVEAASKTVVEIQVENTSTTYGMFGGTYTSTAAGSGVIVSEDGYIITNNHVVEGANKVTVTTYDGKAYDGTVVGTDVRTDIGVIKIDASGLAAAAIGDSDAIRVGDTAIVIGNPLGTLGGTVTSGIISATDREMTINNQAMSLIQTDAAINSGNSGGGLFNGSGYLIGIVNAKDSGMTSSGSMIEGLGFAIPINTALSVANDLMDNGQVNDRPTIGVSIQTITEEYRDYKPGLYIAAVYEGGAAEAAGLMKGDRIVSVDGKEIAAYTELTRVLQNKHVGDMMEFVIEREGREMEFTLTLTGTLESMKQY